MNGYRFSPIFRRFQWFLCLYKQVSPYLTYSKYFANKALMKGQGLIQNIKQNAQGICESAPDFLLSIDIDDFYAPQIDRSFLDSYKNFYRLSKKFFTVIHVWHDTNKSYHAPAPQNQTTPLSNARNYSRKMPYGRGKLGDYILGKEHFSAFKDTDLHQIIPKEANVFVMGAYGVGKFLKNQRLCVDSTIGDGLRAGFNMIAIPDMIFMRYARRRYDGQRVPMIKSTTILKACGAGVPTKSSPTSDTNHHPEA